MSLLFLLLLAGALSSCQSATVFNTRGIPYLVSRYIAWDSLEERIQKDASDVLGYSNFSWNMPGTASIEELALSTISLQSMLGSNNTNTSSTQMEVLAAMNLDDEDQWDCWVNHYEDYYWEEMDNTTIAAWEAMGWNASSWDGAALHPSSENKEWHNLTTAEQQGAVELCYLEETWSGVPLPWTGGMDYALLAEIETLLGSVADNDEEDEIDGATTMDELRGGAVSKSSGLRKKEIPAEEEAIMTSEESAASTVWNSVIPWGLLLFLAWQLWSCSFCGSVFLICINLLLLGRRIQVICSVFL